MEQHRSQPGELTGREARVERRVRPSSYFAPAVPPRTTSAVEGNIPPAGARRLPAS